MRPDLFPLLHRGPVWSFVVKEKCISARHGPTSSGLHCHRPLSAPLVPLYCIHVYVWPNFQEMWCQVPRRHWESDGGYSEDIHELHMDTVTRNCVRSQTADAARKKDCQLEASAGSLRCKLLSGPRIKRKFRCTPAHAENDDANDGVSVPVRQQLCHVFRQATQRKLNGVPGGALLQWISLRDPAANAELTIVLRGSRSSCWARLSRRELPMFREGTRAWDVQRTINCNFPCFHHTTTRILQSEAAQQIRRCGRMWWASCLTL